jgi:hypothetical protein
MYDSYDPDQPPLPPEADYVPGGASVSPPPPLPSESGEDEGESGSEAPPLPPGSPPPLPPGSPPPLPPDGGVGGAADTQMDDDIPAGAAAGSVSIVEQRTFAASQPLAVVPPAPQPPHPPLQLTPSGPLALYQQQHAPYPLPVYQQQPAVPPAFGPIGLAPAPGLPALVPPAVQQEWGALPPPIPSAVGTGGVVAPCLHVPQAQFLPPVPPGPFIRPVQQPLGNVPPGGMMAPLPQQQPGGLLPLVPPRPPPAGPPLHLPAANVRQPMPPLWPQQ